MAVELEEEEEEEAAALGDGDGELDGKMEEVMDPAFPLDVGVALCVEVDDALDVCVCVNASPIMVKM